MLLLLCFIFAFIFLHNYKRVARYSLVFITVLISKLIFKSCFYKITSIVFILVSSSF